jgi:hypothetical protein
MKELIVTYQYNPYASWSPHCIFNQMYDALVETYQDIQFTRVPEHFIDKQVDWTYYINPHIMGIENPENGKKIIVSYADNNACMLLKDEKFGWNAEMVVQAFISTDYRRMVNACSSPNKTDRVFNEFSNEDLNLGINDSIFSPLSYPVWNSDFEKNVSDRLYASRGELAFSKNRKQAMKFRGLLWEPRKNVLEVDVHPEIFYDGTKLPFLEYGKEMLEYRCGLSLNGNGEICNRDIELMSLGIPVFRPVLKNAETKNPLIPNYHYVAFEFDREPSSTAGHPGSPLSSNSKLVWESMISRWEEVKNDYEYLDFVAHNGRMWYEQNGKYEQHVKIFMDTINLNLLG